MYDFKDDRGVPISAGIPAAVRIAAAVGLLIIFAVIYMVSANSSVGHRWPASTASQEKL